MIDLGCDMEITGLLMMNTHHAHWGGFSSKRVEVRLQDRADAKKWNTIMSGELMDSLGKVCVQECYKQTL